MKKLFLAAALTVSVALPLTTHAGIPVVDAGSIAQAVIQVTELKKQYDQMINQYNLSKQQYDALKNNVSLNTLQKMKLSNNIYDAKAGLNEIQAILGDVGNLSAKSKASEFKAKADRLSSLYKSEINNSNARIEGNIKVINSLKSELASGGGGVSDLNNTDTAQVNAAIQDAYQQIEMEKSLQAGLSKSMRNGLGLIGKKYSTAKWVENTTKGTAWN